MDFLSGYWISLASLIVQCGFLKWAWKIYKEYQSKITARDAALRALLRGEIISTCHKAEKQGFITIYNVENLNSMYGSYAALGGNGGIKSLIESTLQLPHMAQGMGSEQYD